MEGVRARVLGSGRRCVLLTEKAARAIRFRRLLTFRAASSSMPQVLASFLLELESEEEIFGERLLDGMRPLAFNKSG